MSKESRRKIAILMYHYIGKSDDVNDSPYWVSEQSFTQQMQFLRRRGFCSISLDDLVGYLYHDMEIPKKSVVITFDDGHVSFYEKARKPLVENGFSATMFLIADRIGQEGFMDKNQIRDMQDEGFHFESHSLTHAIITKLSINSMKKEVYESKRVIEEVTGRSVRYFCYRGGHYNEQAKELIRQAGYRGAVCSRFGYNGKNTDPMELMRIPVRGNDSLSVFSAKTWGLDWQRKPHRFLSRYIMR